MQPKDKRPAPDNPPSGDTSGKREVPGVWEYYDGKLLKVIDARRSGWWRFHEHYDRDGYCDNPARGY